MTVEWAQLAPWALGWTIGWLLLWRNFPLPTVGGEGGVGRGAAGRRTCSVVIPARDEASSITTAVAALAGQLRPGDDLVVVDDHSSDDTADRASAAGAVVVDAPDLPEGWLGKPHACWVGAGATGGDILVFVDADVAPSHDLLDRIDQAITRSPDRVVSVQPWHHTGRFVEQASLLGNVTALMGCGAFTIRPSRRANVAFGAVLAITRTRYVDVGGHAAPAVRAEHLEDIALARQAGGAALYTGRPDIRFRMYPDGLRATVRGWTRTTASGMRVTPWWIAIGVIAWIWSLAGGWLVEPWVYPFSAGQVWVLGRRAGSIHPITALLYPVAVAVFVVIVLRSVGVAVSGRGVRWKDRPIRT